MLRITDVTITLAHNPARQRQSGRKVTCLAYVVIEFDHCFVVRDMKVLELYDKLILAMPSRRRVYRCEKCRCKNHLQANYCNQCGHALPEKEMGSADRLFDEVTAPLTKDFLRQLESRVLRVYHDTLAKEAARI